MICCLLAANNITVNAVDLGQEALFKSPACHSYLLLAYGVELLLEWERGRLPSCSQSSPNHLFFSSFFSTDIAVVLFNAVALSFSFFLQTSSQQNARIWVNRSFQTAMTASCLLSLPRPGNRCVLLCESGKAMRKDSSRLFHLHPGCFFIRSQKILTQHTSQNNLKDADLQTDNEVPAEGRNNFHLCWS